MDQKHWYQMSIAEIERFHRTDANSGLSVQEAKDRLANFGNNELLEKKTVSPITLFLNQFRDFMVLVLVGAVLISGLLGEYLDAITIIAIILMNGILGFIQEYRAERSLSALKKMSSPTARVIRSGKVERVDARLLVPGDVVLLEGGDRIPADVRFIVSNGLNVEESALTGESIPVLKHVLPIQDEEVPLGDQKNLGFMGTMVLKGTGKAIVVQTGMQTEMGKIADLIQNTESMETPLQHRLEQLGKLLIGVAIFLTIIVVVAGIMHGQPPYGMFLAGVSLAVAAIPEGLPAIVTIALAIGVQRMIRRKAIVRKLPSVETLGSASVICSDKTGTLTENKMTVTHLWGSGRSFEVTGIGYEPTGNILERNQVVDVRKDSLLRRLMQISVLCNNTELVQEAEEDIGKRKKRIRSIKRKTWTIKGDPTEGALTVLGAKAGLSRDSLSAMYRRILELPFDSERKRMTVVVEHQGGQLVCTKGAPDVLLQQCTHILWNGMIKRLDPAFRMKVLEANEKMARSALRVLALAYKDLGEKEYVENQSGQFYDTLEQNLVFVGLAGMIDPPREEVREAIRKCRNAGIKTVMITGDHRTTAEAIASKLGMIPKGGKTISGKELDALDNEALEQVAEDIYVYARVTPEHKLRIVKALQRRGHVVAMTGDGVNDAPAIKAADIGIAMGITGTDVTKEASALVLSDDNFATIVSAIEEGRGIFENIRKFIRYMLASNVGEILTMFIAMMLGMPLPLVPIMILWVNLVTDGLPAMALGVDQAEEDLMKHQPRPAKENIFARGLGWKIVSRGILIGLSTLGAFWIVLNEGSGIGEDLVLAQTVAFSTLVMAQLIHVFDCRSSKSIFHRNLFENKALVLAVISSVLLLLIVLYVEPLQPIFKTAPLSIDEWMIVLIFSAIPTFLTGFFSVFYHHQARRKKKITVHSNPLMR